MSASARIPDPSINVVIDKGTQSSASEINHLVANPVAPLELNGPVIDGEVAPSAEDISAERATEDLEALHQVPSGPAYSVFSNRQRKFIISMVACAGFFSPLSANIYFPALNALSRDLKVSNELINLTLTSYMIFQGLAPTIFGDLADMAGRRPAYLLGFIIYIGTVAPLAKSLDSC